MTTDAKPPTTLTLTSWNNPNAGQLTIDVEPGEGRYELVRVANAQGVTVGLLHIVTPDEAGQPPLAAIGGWDTDDEWLGDSHVPLSAPPA